MKQFKAKQIIGTDERGWVILELDTTKLGEYWKRVDQHGEFPKSDAELFASAPSLLAQRDALAERVKELERSLILVTNQLESLTSLDTRTPATNQALAEASLATSNGAPSNASNGLATA